MRSTKRISGLLLAFLLLMTGIYADEAEKVQQPQVQKIDYGPDHVWTGQDGKPLPFSTQDDLITFLTVAEPVQTETLRTGVTRPQKMLLKKEGVEIRAVFRHQSRVDKSPSPAVGTAKGSRYFRDCYKSEIAAFDVNRLLGLNNMPPTICRTINGKQGTLQLWVEGTITEKNRAKDKIVPPDERSWNRQMWDTQVFDNLINNIDRNQGNLLIDSNWRLILIDHTQSFSRDVTLPNPEKVTHCSRGLWHNLRHLDETTVTGILTPYLSRLEMEALFKRKDFLIKLIQDLIDKKGEDKVLF
jgi:hypothetical protein